jgi:tetratricopeptide (TPR) repeat protein
MASGPQLMPTNTSKRAFQALARGDTSAAEALFRENLEEKSQEGVKANREAAEAARNIAGFKRLTNVAEAADLYSRAAGFDPENYQTWIDLGDMTLRAGHLVRARSAFERSLAIAERLAQTDPGNTGRQRDLSVSRNKLGDVQQAQGDLAAALTSYQASLAIAERLAQADPGNAGWQRDLSISHERIGDVQRAQGDLAAALTNYQASLAIRERLAQADPGNAGWQRDLAVSFGRVAMVESRQGRRDDALKAFRSGRDIIARLARQSPANATLPKDLTWFDSQISNHSK